MREHIMFPAKSKQKKGNVSAVFPDVCKVPAPPAPFVPAPFPNINLIAKKLDNAANRFKKFALQFE